MDTLCGATANIGPMTPAIDQKYSNNIIASVLYGEETFRANQVYDRGTCRRDAVIPPVMFDAATAPH